MLKRLLLSVEMIRSIVPVDVVLLFAARLVRLTAYGALSVVLVLYLTAAGLDESRVGLMLTLTLVGDVIVSVGLATRADRIGRRRVLLMGAWLMFAAGLIFAIPGLPFLVLLIVATVGVISPSGHEVGPFLPVEQAALAQLVPTSRRTAMFGWYTLAGSLATAFGALVAGFVANVTSTAQLSSIMGQQTIVILYAVAGFALVLIFCRVGPGIETNDSLDGNAVPLDPLHALLGLHRSRRTVLHLAGLFALDAFGGGFIMQSLLAFWFYVRFGVDIETLGWLFFAANVLAGFSALVATRLAARIGLVRTMVFTHLPSNVLLILVPLMPSFGWSAAVLLVRYSISQMDVPARQSYTMSVVDPAERSAAAAITGVARTAGAAFAPFLALPLLANQNWAAVPFFVAGGLKIVYDLLLWRSFDSVKPQEENEVRID